MRKFIQNLVWVTTLAIVIVNMKQVLHGYEKKMECIWDSTGAIVGDAVQDVFNETDHTTQTYYNYLREANFSTALEKALEPTLEIGSFQFCATKFI